MPAMTYTECHAKATNYAKISHYGLHWLGIQYCMAFHWITMHLLNLKQKSDFRLPPSPPNPSPLSFPCAFLSLPCSLSCPPNHPPTHPAFNQPATHPPTQQGREREGRRGVERESCSCGGRGGLLATGRPTVLLSTTTTTTISI